MCCCRALNAFKCESLWIEIHDDSRANVIVGVCYKCPLVSEQELKEMFNAIKHAAESRCLILGDFNYPNIDWDSWECNKDSEEFVDLIQDNFFCFSMSEKLPEGVIYLILYFQMKYIHD